jgi:hypothetical protein
MSGTLAPSTPTNRRLAGVTSATVDGTFYSVTEFSWDPASVQRETMSSLSGVDGYKETPVAPYIELKIRDGQNVSVTGFTGKVNSTVVIQLANGKQIVGHNLWYVERPGVTAEAVVSARFEGVQGTIQEIGNS